ncbi:MAG: helix-turn-helix domain-containing protein [Treponema sp.]|jgi:transcriptional regulator with XRE-family HTH domain|nr:helix-turn-helix domain-containing protein [Treponema sp.]
MEATINERIVKLRRTLKLTQPVFAEKICISKGYIANLELGQKEVNDRIIRLISTTFGVNEQWLKTGEDPMFHDSRNPKVEEITRMFKNLNPFFQDFFLDQLRKIYDYERGKK